MRTILFAVGAVLLLVILTIGYLAMSRAATNDRVRAAHDVLSRVDRERQAASTKLTAAFGVVAEAKNGSFDPAKARTEMASASTEIDALRSTDSADVELISHADAKVQDRSLFTALGGRSLDRQHRRLSAARRGVQAELIEIEIMKKQLGIISDLMTVLVQLKPLNADMEAQNVPAAAKDFAEPSASLDKLVAEASGAQDTPTKLNEFLGIFRGELNHIKNLLDAAQRRNLTGVKTALESIQSDVKALGNFDTAALKQQYEDLGRHLDDTVTAEFKAAK
ncbi:MAG: hypothetical protein ABR573_00210 [Candidatus Dormibacteria bacterium]